MEPADVELVLQALGQDPSDDQSAIRAVLTDLVPGLSLWAVVARRHGTTASVYGLLDRKVHSLRISRSSTTAATPWSQCDYDVIALGPDAAASVTVLHEAEQETESEKGRPIRDKRTWTFRLDKDHTITVETHLHGQSTDERIEKFAQALMQAISVPDDMSRPTSPVGFRT
jgi:hypothetical protein